MRAAILCILLIAASWPLMAEDVGPWIGTKIPDGQTVEMRQEGDRELSVRVDQRQFTAAISVPVVGSLSQVTISPWVNKQYVALIEISGNGIYSYFCLTFGVDGKVLTPSILGHIITTAEPLVIRNLQKDRGDAISADLIAKAGVTFRYEHRCPNPPVFGTLTVKPSGPVH